MIDFAETWGEGFCAVWSYLRYYKVSCMVLLRLKVGSKGQIVIPKVIREKLRIKPNRYVIAEFEEGQLRLRGSPDIAEIVAWLGATRRPVAKNVSGLSLEEEVLEALP